jgi:hypothetical protein
MSPQEVNVKAVNLHESWKDMVNAASYGRNETSPAQDIESGDSWGTQPVVVLPQGLTIKDFTFIYTNIICATGAKDLRCSGVGPNWRKAAM